MTKKNQNCAADPGHTVQSRDRETSLSGEAQGNKPPWEVLVIDDDRVLQSLTSAILDGFSYRGRPVKLIQGYSAADAMRKVSTSYGQSIQR